MPSHGDRRVQIVDFRDSFEWIKWLYLHSKCRIKTKTHFEWLLWHWSSLGQLNLEPTRPNGLVGCKVPSDLVKISVKEATHMGFYYIMTQYFCTYASSGPCELYQMMTSSNGNLFNVPGLLCGEFTGHRWIPLTTANAAELWCFLWSTPWINGWVNNREAGDLRRHRVHHDVIVMDLNYL